jgi:hypothetical protein
VFEIANTFEIASVRNSKHLRNSKCSKRDFGLRCGREKEVKKYERRRQKHCPEAHSLPYAGPRVPRGGVIRQGVVLADLSHLLIVNKHVCVCVCVCVCIVS